MKIIGYEINKPPFNADLLPSIDRNFAKAESDCWRRRKEEICATSHAARDRSRMR